MSITIVNLRSLVDAPGAPAYPASNYTLHKDDWNDVRAALTAGTKGIYTKGLKLGSEGLEVIGDTPVLLPNGAIVRFLDGGLNNAVVASIAHDGEWHAKQYHVDHSLHFAAGATVVLQGDLAMSVPETARTHQVLSRGATQVEDLDVFHDGNLFALRVFSGTFWANALGHGVAFKNAGGVAQVYLNDDGELALRDVVSPTARPWTYANERTIVTATPGTEMVADILGTDGVEALEVQASPRLMQVRLEEAGVNADRLNIGPGAVQVNVDALWSGGGGTGALASLVTPAERTAIGTHTSQIAAIQAELAACIKVVRTATGDEVVPDGNGKVNLANSSSVIFDKTGPNTVRAVAVGGGGGGAVASVTPGVALNNSGTSTNPVLDVDYGAGLKITTGQLVPDFGTAAGKVAEGNHSHAGVYSPVAHTHAGVYIAVGGAYQDLVDASKIGTSAGTVAAGDDGRFHTQNTDLGTSALTFVLRRSYGGTPATSDIVALDFERGTLTNARIKWDELNDKFVAGVIGAEEAIILESDARLTDARDPNPHALDGPEHTGTLPGSDVGIAYIPGNYAAGPVLETHFAGIDTVLGNMVTATHHLLGGQTIMGVAISSFMVTGQYLVGSVASGVDIITDGEIETIIVQSQLPVDAGANIMVTVRNITTATEVSVPLAAGDEYNKATVSLAVSQGDEISVRLSAVVGVPACGILTVHVIKAGP